MRWPPQNPRETEKEPLVFICVVKMVAWNMGIDNCLRGCTKAYGVMHVPGDYLNEIKLRESMLLGLGLKCFD